MRRSVSRTLIACALLAALAGIAWVLTSLLSVERLRETVEERLAEATGHPVTIGELQLALGVGIQVRGRDIQLWPQPDGPALRIERLGIGVDPLALLIGRVRPRRIRLEGAELRITELAEGRFAAPFDAPAGPEPEASPHPDELLKPLIVFENGLRALLARTPLADAFEVRRSRLRLALLDGDGQRRELAIDLDDGELLHRRLLGDDRLDLVGRLSDPTGELGTLRAEGRRDASGEIELEVELAEVELSGWKRHWRGLDPGADLAGRGDVRVAFTSKEPGSARLELAARVSGLEARALKETWGPVRSDALEIEAALAIEPDVVALETARLAGSELRVEVTGRVARPLQETSAAELAFTFRDLSIEQLRALVDWLPFEQARTVDQVLSPVVSGRLVELTARGGGTLGEWQQLLSGGQSLGVMALGAEAEVAALAVRVQDKARIDGLKGRARWSGDRLEVSGVRGVLDGEPLPVMDLRVDGLSRLLASNPDQRRLTAGAPPLPGIAVLAEMLKDPEDEEPGPPIDVSLEVEWLHHPACLWPLEGLRARVQSQEGGLRVELAEGRWAGVAVRGDADWFFEPEQRVRASIEALETGKAQARRPGGRTWARGRFRVGPVVDPYWNQTGAQGVFRATAGVLRVQEGSVDLDPAGRIEGSAAFDLSGADAVPFQLSVALAGGDVDALMRQVAEGREVASGRVDAWGTFDGSLRPGDPAFRDFSGLLEIQAADGNIRRSLPPIVSIALASKSLNPFAERESIRYRSASTLLEFTEGKLKTSELSIDGPDMRVVASGQLDLVNPDHRLKGDVALFLFRQIDRAVNTIPLLNVLLLGTNKNLLAAYFQIEGPWSKPETQLVPLKSFATGPASLVLDGVPRVVGLGMRALESMWKTEEKPAPPPPVGPEEAPWRETPGGA